MLITDLTTAFNMMMIQTVFLVRLYLSMLIGYARNSHAI